MSLLKRKYVLVGIACALLLICMIVVLLIIQGNNLTSTGSESVTEPNEDENQQSEELTWKSYLYDEEYIIPGFSVGYPNWNESISQSSGAWDISLENNDSKLFIDLSGQGNSSFEQSLSDWVTNWGSKSVNYSYEVLENGMLAENRNFIIYKVSEDNKDPYILAIVDVAQMYEGRGHLAVKAEREEDINYVEEIIASVKTIN